VSKLGEIEQMSHEKDDENLLSKFEKHVNSQAYLEAVNFTITPREEQGLDPRDDFKSRLFGKDHIFLKALANAAKYQTDGKARLDDLSKNLPPWFINVTDVPKDWYKKNEWYKSYREKILKAQICCARHVIDHPSLDNSQPGWAELAEQANFPIGFVYDLSKLLKNDKFCLERGKNLRKIPILLEKGYGGTGQAAYLFIEQVKLDMDMQSEPYPHPIEMSTIPVKQDLQEAINSAFHYICSELAIRNNFREDDLPVFRWWVKPATKEEKEIKALEGPSLFGAFAIGMLSLARSEKIQEGITITCNGNELGYLSDIGGLAQKCQAAERQQWKYIIIADGQDIENKDYGNAIDDVHQPMLMYAENVKKAYTYFTSRIEFDTRDYLDLVFNRLGTLPQNELPLDCPKDIGFDEITVPMKVISIVNDTI